MFPLRDNIPPRTFPWVNYAIIAACSGVFFLQLAEEGTGRASLVERFGMIPARVVDPDKPVQITERVPVPGGFVERQRLAVEPPIPAWMTVVTCIFLHGGWLHFLGNMWFLHIFGDNVEDRLGHVPYLLFYLGCGAVASLVQLFSAPGSEIPTIGASGAIAGVMGGYLFLYPAAKVVSLVPVFVFIQILVLPAPVFLVIWFAFQFFQGVMTVSDVQAGGVAWWAHIGGFACGFLAVIGLSALHAVRPKVQTVRPHTEHSGMYRYRYRQPRW